MQARRRSQSPASRRWSPTPSRAASIGIVASVAQKPPHFIIAQPGIKTVQELRGKRFGVLSLHEGTTYFVQDIETAIGFKRGDIIIDAVGGAPTRWKLLREGKIDAGLQPFPLSYEFGSRGLQQPRPDLEIRSRLRIHRGVPRSSLGQRQPAGGHGIPARAAPRPGRHRRRSGPAAAVLVRELSTTPDYARRAIGDALKFKLMPDGLAASEAGMRRVFATLQRAGLVPNDQPFDMGRFVDPSYLAAAQ